MIAKMIWYLAIIIIINFVTYTFSKVEINYYASNGSTDISIQNKEKNNNVWNMITSEDFKTNARYLEPCIEPLINDTEISMTIDLNETPCAMCYHLNANPYNSISEHPNSNSQRINSNSWCNCECHVNEKKQNQQFTRAEDGMISPFIDIDVKECSNNLFKQNEMTCICKNCKNADNSMLGRDTSILTSNLRQFPEVIYYLNDLQDNISTVQGPTVQLDVVKLPTPTTRNPQLEIISQQPIDDEYVFIADRHTREKSRKKRQTPNRNFAYQPFNKFNTRRQYPLNMQPSNGMMGSFQKNVPAMSGNSFPMQPQTLMKQMSNPAFPSQVSYPNSFPPFPFQMPQMPMIPGMSQIPGLSQIPGMPFIPTMQNVNSQTQYKSHPRFSSPTKVQLENNMKDTSEESEEVIRIVLEPNKKEEPTTSKPYAHFKRMNPDSSAEIQFVVLSNGDVVPVSNMEKKIHKKFLERSNETKKLQRRNIVNSKATSTEKRRNVQPEQQQTKTKTTAKHADDSFEEIYEEDQSLEKIKNEHPSYSKRKRSNHKRILRTLPMPETDEIAKDHSENKHNRRRRLQNQ